METFDVIVIGGGPGGYPAAINASQLGASVALVERECLGGTCLNWGCIPTKTLIASSTLYHSAQHGSALGVSVNSASYDYKTMIERKDDVVAKLSGGVGMLLKGNGVTVLEGTASFIDKSTLEVKKGKETTKISAPKIIIASGSVSAMPSFIPPSPRIMDSRIFLTETELPSSLLVLGGGVIGCEFACMAAQLGCEVTIIEILDDILLLLDADVRTAARKYMESELKIRILTGAPMADIEAGVDAVTGSVGAVQVKGELLLVAVGRVPSAKSLKVENAGIELAESGHIEIDDSCLTSTAGIYAIGDVTAGSTQLAHAATAQGITAATNAILGKVRPNETVIPSCIFTQPEIGCVGLTEEQAQMEGIPITKGRFAFMALGKAMASGETGGFVKWLVHAETDRLLGAAVVGAHATELISEAAVAIRAGLTAADLGNTVHCHPTMSEAWLEAAHAVHGTCIHALPRTI
jgi:dihydrolipoamide dehydrogenase